MLISYFLMENGVLTNTNFFIYMQSFLEMLFCTCVGSFRFKRKKYFVLRVTASIAVMIGLVFLFGYLRTLNGHIVFRILYTLLLFLYFLFALWLCFDENILELLLNWSSVLLCREIAEILYSFLLASLQVNSRTTFVFIPALNQYWNAFFCDLIHMAVQAVLILIFCNKDSSEKDKKFTLFLILIAITEIVFIVGIKTFMLAYQSESNAMFLISKGLMLVLCLIVLFFKKFMQEGNKDRQNIAIMESVISSEKKQYESMKSSIDIINMKCHDIRHQLENYHDKLAEDEITSLKNAISIYDKTIHTGNATLDTILYEKQLYCDNSSITFTHMVNGEILSFLKPAEIYSLINNMLDNAIEAVSKLETKEKRILGLSVSDEEGNIRIETYNYFNPNIINKDLSTTKKDSAGHGYGMKSIQYIASLNHGTMSYHIENDMFFIQVNIPKQQ